MISTEDLRNAGIDEFRRWRRRFVLASAILLCAIVVGGVCLAVFGGNPKSQQAHHDDDMASKSSPDPRNPSVKTASAGLLLARCSQLATAQGQAAPINLNRLKMKAAGSIVPTGV
jgi:ABC-type uncharacterized transport system permease subunit